MVVVLRTLVQIMGGHFSFVFVGLFACLMTLVQVIKRISHHELEQKDRQLIFFTATFAGPIALLIGISYLIQPAFLDRYLIVILLPFTILTASFLSNMKIGPYVVLLILTMLWVKYSDESNKLVYTEDWKSVAHFISDEYQEGDTVGFFVYYLSLIHI